MIQTDIEKFNGSVFMKEVLLQNLCNYVLDLLPTIPDLGDKEKEVLKEKIRTVALRALHKKSALFADFQELPETEVGRILISRILTEVLKDSSADVASKVVQSVMDTFQASPPALSNLVWDSADRSWDPTKEGQAKKYEKTGKKVYDPLSFSTWGNKPITQQQLADMFKDELATRYQSKYKNIFSEGRKGLDFLSKIFEEALEETSERIKKEGIDPERRLDKFFQCYLKKHRNTQYREQITREIFQDLMGEHVGGYGTKTPLDLKDPHIKRLVKEYENGTWKAKETRELITPYIADEEDRKFRPVFDEIQELPEFISIMRRYFNSL